MISFVSADVIQQKALKKRSIALPLGLRMRQRKTKLSLQRLFCPEFI